MTRLFYRLRWILGALVLLLAVSALVRQLHGLSFAELRIAWGSTSGGTIALSLLGTAVSFACLAWFELFATQRVAPGRVPVAAALQVGAMSHAIANTLGFHALTGGAVRLRGYRGFGLGVADVAKVLAVVAACVGIGVVAVTAIALLWAQSGADGWQRAAMVAAAPVLLIFLVLLPTRIRGPGEGSGLRLLRQNAWVPVVGLVEMAAAIGSLYVLLPADVAPPLASFVLVFVGAILLGIASHAPGGIGVFEATILAALPSDRRAPVLVALLLYRLLYSLVPFGVATAAWLVAWLRSRLTGVNSTADTSALPAADGSAVAPTP